ncbi:hypothetical protein KIN20_030261 [Parelaphostrongylus tenuis]|uniref:Uncharacterized protein n=1 Tax=Parelaphostrongylus tenuis TaxID=148309 RepID=A0AAD5R3Q8_PARTN|nr:hypothetical protein KIN20_030261 [Parelaphostrongylus tenuis]
MPQGQACLCPWFTLTHPGPQFPGIAANRDAASSLVSRLIMQTVTDVLSQQGRSAGLPDAITSAILNQLMVQIRYVPLECKEMTVEIPPK